MLLMKLSCNWICWMMFVLCLQRWFSFEYTSYYGKAPIAVDWLCR